MLGIFFNTWSYVYSFISYVMGYNKFMHAWILLKSNLIQALVFWRVMQLYIVWCCYMNGLLKKATVRPAIGCVKDTLLTAPNLQWFNLLPQFCSAYFSFYIVLKSSGFLPPPSPWLTETYLKFLSPINMFTIGLRQLLWIFIKFHLNGQFHITLLNCSVYGHGFAMPKAPIYPMDTCTVLCLYGFSLLDTKRSTH
jgi:hypothetical protein